MTDPLTDAELAEIEALAEHSPGSSTTGAALRRLAAEVRRLREEREWIRETLYDIIGSHPDDEERRFAGGPESAPCCAGRLTMTEHELVSIADLVRRLEESEFQLTKLCDELLATLQFERNRESCTRPVGRTKLWALVDGTYSPRFKALRESQQRRRTANGLPRERREENE